MFIQSCSSVFAWLTGQWIGLRIYCFNLRNLKIRRYLSIVQMKVDRVQSSFSTRDWLSHWIKWKFGGQVQPQNSCSAVEEVGGHEQLQGDLGGNWELWDLCRRVGVPEVNVVIVLVPVWCVFVGGWKREKNSFMLNMMELSVLWQF